MLQEAFTVILLLLYECIKLCNPHGMPTFKTDHEALHLVSNVQVSNV